MIDSTPFFGGVMSSFQFQDFYVDKGVHIFDSIPRTLASTVTEIMDGNVHDIDFVSASAFNGKITEGFSLPDLNSLDDTHIKDTIQKELVNLSQRNEDQPLQLKSPSFFVTAETAASILVIFSKRYII